MRKSGVLKILFMLAAAILLLQQIFNYAYIKHIDRQYSDIITDKLEVLRSSELSFNESAKLQHSMVHLIHSEGKDFDSIKKDVDLNSSKIENLIAKMRRHSVSADENASLDSLSSVFGTYKTKYNSDLALLESGSVDSAKASHLITDLRESYNDLVSKQLKQSAFFIGSGERISDEISANTSKTSTLLFVIGILPFIILSLIMVTAGFTLFILGYSVNWFRSLE